jgi:thiol-disulfide isomerase/thioredoxin
MIMNNKINQFLFLLSIITVNAFGKNERKETIVELKMDTVLNTNIQVRIVYEDENLDRKVLYRSGKLENNTWTFCLPDKIESIAYINLAAPMENDSIGNEVGFAYISGNDTLTCSDVHFKNGHSISTLKFVKSGIFPNIFYSDEKTGETKIKTVYQDAYIVEETNDLELLSSIESLDFARNFYNDEIPYENKIQRFISSAKEYPKSHSLIVGLASYMTAFKSKEDVANIYNCFSDETKNTYFGKKIDQYLAQTFFDNIMLPAWDTEILESVIKDNTKYNLVVFTASWCPPCHEMIPILKQAYSDLHDKIDVVYISIDEPKTVKLWKELMITEEIPWRSVLAKDQVKLIKDKYSVQGVPCTFLVSPHNEITRVELRNEKEKAELYKLFDK